MSIEESYKNKRVLVTGAGKGIGRALVAKLYSYGATVYALSRTESDLALLVAECPGVKPLKVNLVDWDETKKAVESCGVLDVVLNVAGVGHEEPFLEVSSSFFDEIMSINLKAVVNVSQTAAKEMIRGGRGGSIVNISSRLAHRAFPDCSIYSASKAALDQLTKSMCFELGRYGIRVNSVNLGGVWTPMWASTFAQGAVEGGRADYNAFVERVIPRIPAGKPFVPMEDVLNTVLFTASGLTSMLTGANIALDGGYTVT